MMPPTSTAMVYSQEEVWFPCSLDVAGWDEKFHELMLNDCLRMEAYEAAIRGAVRPGDVVLDLGTGTGVLARWALAAGAARVYGIEVNSKILALAQQNLRQAGFSDRFRPIHALSFDAALPERVDLIISETIGNFGDNEDCHHILTDARARFLKPGGRMIPERVTTFLVPVSSPRAHQQIEQGRCKAISETYDLRRLLARLKLEDPFDVYYDVVLPQSCYLAAPQQARIFDFLSGSAQPEYQITLQFPVVTPGFLTGFKGYFVANLIEDVVLDISGADIVRRTSSDSWKHCYLPLRQPMDVTPGQNIIVTVERRSQQNHTSPFSFRYQWRVETAKERAVDRPIMVAGPELGHVLTVR